MYIVVNTKMHNKYIKAWICLYAFNGHHFEQGLQKLREQELLNENTTCITQPKVLRKGFSYLVMEN